MGNAKSHFDIMAAAMQGGRSGEVILGLLHSIARLYQFVEATHRQPGLGIGLLDQEIATLQGPDDLPGVRSTLEVLRSILAEEGRKPH